MFKARPPQQAILDYTGGKVGVSAVPGSGKTHTLSALAARLITEGMLEDDQEVLIVTLVNSAVDNFSSRIERFLNPFHLVPGFGYRVRTLHGLAHDIVRERPDLVGLSTRFQIADERDSDLIIRDSAVTWLRANPDFHTLYTKSGIDPHTLSDIITRYWPEYITQMGTSFISQAKDLQILPDDIATRLAGIASPPALFSMALEIYKDYQRALGYRNAVDFNDLIRLALQAIQTDPDYLARLRHRWPFILEDEAQDSSRLQENILSLLVGANGNWVRVGDPNQAIYETFTTANPRFLLNFRERSDVVKRDLPHSGRSTVSIIQLSNHLIDWVRLEHPVEALQSALTEPHILPTLPDDPQPNPPDHSGGIYISRQKWTPEEETRKVVASICRWLPEHPEHTVAVLVPRNERGAQVASELRRNNIEPVELLRSSQSTRQTAAVIASVLAHLADPTHSFKLAALFQLIFPPDRNDPVQRNDVRQVARLIQENQSLEDYIWPRPDRDWLADLFQANPQLNPEPFLKFRTLLQHWHAAVLLPVDQLILTISQDLLTQPPDLALAHKLAQLLEHESSRHPEWDLSHFSQELQRIAGNERKFLGFSSDDSSFDPDQHKGQVVVTTIHKAKGLEWDRVYLLSVNNYDFPSPDNFDAWISEKWFIRDQLNLEAELISQLKNLLHEPRLGLLANEGEPTQEARLEYASERLRLLFVGITRARRDLMISWNTGRKGSSQMCTPLLELIDFLEEKASASS